MPEVPRGEPRDTVPGCLPGLCGACAPVIGQKRGRRPAVSLQFLASNGVIEVSRSVKAQVRAMTHLGNLWPSAGADVNGEVPGSYGF